MAQIEINPGDNDRLKTRKVQANLAELGVLPANHALRPTFLKGARTAAKLIDRALADVTPVVERHCSSLSNFAQAANQKFTAAFGVIDVGGGPVVPYIFSDFQNGIYQREGVDVPVTDLWEANPEFGLSFDPDISIVAGEGLAGEGLLTESAGSLIDIAQGLTVIMVANLSIAEGAAGMYAMADLMDLPDFQNEQIAQFYVEGGGVTVRGRLKDYNNGKLVGPSLPIANDHKFAALSRPDLLAMSVEGGAVEEYVPTGVTNIRLGVSSNAGIKIRSVGLYPAQDQTTLPALSAL